MCLKLIAGSGPYASDISYKVRKLFKRINIIFRVCLAVISIYHAASVPS
jgi:hypothetical protein